jgi:hypothetical protein
MMDQEISKSEQKKEDWMNSKWRPMMGWMYMLVCTMDFIVFPILWSIHQTLSHGNVSAQWNPLTLQGAGLFHMAMGAVIGVAAFGRTQEKLAGANNGGAPITAPTPTPMPSVVTPTPRPSVVTPTIAPISKPMPKPMPPSADDFADPPMRNTRSD